MNRLNANDRTVLQRCMLGAIRYTYAPDPKGGTHAKLIGSTASISLRKHLERLAQDGYVSRTITGCEGRREPPETVVCFTITALGREAIDAHQAVKPLVNVSRPKSAATLLEEANQRD